MDQIKPFDLSIPERIEGTEYSHALGDAPGILEVLPTPRSGYFVTLTIDQDKARAAEVENALILAQMLGNDLTSQQAEDDSVKIDFQGWIRIEFDLDPSGTVSRKTERSEVTIQRPDEDIEIKTSVTTVTRLDMETALKKFAE